MAKSKKNISASTWMLRIKDYENRFAKFLALTEKLRKRYRGESSSFRDNDSTYNLGWSIIQIVGPAVYSRDPNVIVRRRFLDSSPVARVAAEVLERAAATQIEDYSFSDVVKGVRDSMLLFGRGTAWVRYEPQVSVARKDRVLLRKELQVDEDGLQTVKILNEDGSEFDGDLGAIVEDNGEVFFDPGESVEIDYENAVCDLVHHRDFYHGPGRDWSEVQWVARRTYLTRDQIEERFGTSVAKKINTDTTSDRSSVSSDVDPRLVRVPVFECWNKPDKKVYWVSPCCDDLLDVQDDFLKLKDFFPTPRPVYSSTDPDSLIPLPLLSMVSSLLNELDLVSTRISAITKSLKVVGLYDASIQDMPQMFLSRSENRLIPVTNFAGISGGSFSDRIWFFPMGQISGVLQELHQQRLQIERLIYETLGVSDILRGVSDPRETATAQGIKQQNASIRIRDMQKEMERYVRDLMSIKAEIISRYFEPKTLLLTSGMKLDTEQDVELFDAAISFLRDANTRSLLLDVESDSTVQIDSNVEKEQRIEFIQASASFLERLIGISSVSPQLVPALAETMMFVLRAFPAARSVEPVFEQALNDLRQQIQSPQQSPDQGVDANPASSGAELELLRLQQERDNNAAKIELEREKNQGKLAIEEAKIKAKLSLEEQELLARLDLEREKILSRVRTLDGLS